MSKLILPPKVQPLKRRKVCIAIPAYGGSVTTLTFKSLYYDVLPMVIAKGWEIQVLDEIGHADIYSLRAQIVSTFLNDERFKNYDDLVMLDSDLGWAPGVLPRLLEHKVDYCAVPYPKRSFPIQFMFRSEHDIKDGMTMDINPATGLVEVWGMPGGMMRTTRRMLKAMWDRYDGEYGVYDHAVPGEHTVRMFDPYYWTDDEGRKRCLSEDYAFGQRWRDMGGKVWMDVHCSAGHVGTHTFTGQMGHFNETESAA